MSYLVCPSCEHKIKSRGKFCPLCGQDFISSGIGEPKIFSLAPAFEKRTYFSFFSVPLLDKVYLSFLFLSSLIMILTEGFLTKWAIQYSYFIIALLVYVYILLSLTTKGSHFFPQKILIQAVILSIISYFMTGFFPQPGLVFSYILPTIFLASLLSVAFYIFINYNLPEKHAINLIVMALLATIPYIIAVIKGISNQLYSLIVACIGGIFVVIGFSFFGKRIWHELKSIFHT